MRLQESPTVNAGSRRILLLVSDLTGGGAERVAVNLAAHWATRGHGVTLLATYSGRGDCVYRIPAGVRLLYLADEAGARGRGLGTYLRRFLAMRRLIGRERPDLVVSFLTNVNVAAIVCAAGLGVPVIVSERTYPPAFPLSPSLELLRRVLYPLSSRVVVQTRESLHWLQTRIPKAVGCVIPNPVEVPVPASDPFVEPREWVGIGQRLLLAVGRLSEEKGYQVLIEAFGELSHCLPQWNLVILGEGPERANLQAQVATLGLKQRILLPGRAGNVQDWYVRSDLFVMSSRFEGFPNSLLEAMASGRAAVSFDCDTGPRDLIVDGENGLLVRPVGDRQALAAALARMMGDDAMRARMAGSAAGVGKLFGMTRVLGQWDRVFDEVTATR